MSTSGNSGTDNGFSVADCSYLDCQLPTCMLEVCGDDVCNKYLHHTCMVECQEEKEKDEMNIGVYIPMFKRCKECFNNFIEKQIRQAKEGPDQSGGGVDSNFTNTPDIPNNSDIPKKNAINLIPNIPNQLNSKDCKLPKYPKDCKCSKCPIYTKAIKYFK
eukprot:15351235-Ditylum_brightwellii.AAC.1